MADAMSQSLAAMPKSAHNVEKEATERGAREERKKRHWATDQKDAEDSRAIRHTA